VLFATESGVDLVLGLSLAMLVGGAAIVQLNAGLGSGGVMTQGGVIVLAAVGVINRLLAGLLVLAGVVGDAAVSALLNGHGGSLEGLESPHGSGPLRWKERCFALRRGYFRLNDRCRAPVELNVLSFNAFLPQ
jgi:hypothetical protein